MRRSCEVSKLEGKSVQCCGLNYHKRCASKIPNNCNGSIQRRPSAIPLSPQNSRSLRGRNSNVGTISSAASMLSRLEVTSQTLGASTSQLAPDIFITPENDCGDAIGGNYLQMPRKDRSCSWSGRPLWMEVAEATRVKVPHTFQVHSYKRPTVCQHCKKLLKGLIRQGMQCKDCKYNCHKKCSEGVARDCPGSSITSPGTSYFLGQESDVSGEESSESTSRASSTSHRKASSTLSAPLQSERGTTNYEGGERSPEDEDATTESQNIPLMRVVMSKKHTKRRPAKTLKDGWLLHSTDQTTMRKKHYWRLDTKAITLIHDETSPRYYKELPLSEILDLNLLPADEQKTHVFEIKTSAVTYYVGCGLNYHKRCASKIPNNCNGSMQRRPSAIPLSPQNSRSLRGRNFDILPCLRISRTLRSWKERAFNELRLVLNLGSVLESCDFAVFWKLAKGEYSANDKFKPPAEIAKLIKPIAGFEEAVRLFACRVVSTTFQCIDHKQLVRLLGGVNEAKVTEYSRKFGWESREGDAVCYIATHDSTIKSRNNDERLSFSNVHEVLVHTPVQMVIE